MAKEITLDIDGNGYVVPVLQDYSAGGMDTFSRSRPALIECANKRLFEVRPREREKPFRRAIKRKITDEVSINRASAVF